MTAFLKNSLTCHYLLSDDFDVFLCENVGLHLFLDDLYTINTNWLFEKFQFFDLLNCGNFINLGTVVELILYLSFWSSENVKLFILPLWVEERTLISHYLKMSSCYQTITTIVTWTTNYQNLLLLLLRRIKAIPLYDVI